MPAAWLRRNVFHPCEGGPLLRAIYLVTLVWPISMPSLRSSPWILCAPHNGLAMLISRISRRTSKDTVDRPQRRRDFQRQYDLKPARCQRIGVRSDNCQCIIDLGKQSADTSQDQSVNQTEGGSPGTARRSTLICCLKTRISASSSARGRNRPTTTLKISLYNSNIEQQHRPILDQPPADWIYDRDTGRGHSLSSDYRGSESGMFRCSKCV